MKAVKYLAIGAVGLLLVVGIAAYFLIQNLDSIVKGAIEKFGSEATGTAVTVQNVAIGLQAGEGAIQGLRVANPSGFSGAAIFSLGDISLKLDTASLTGNLPVIQDIHVGTPAVLYEVNQEGQTNVSVLRKNLDAFRREHTSARKKASPSAKDEKKFLVKRLTIEAGQADIDLSAVGGDRMSAEMGTITLTNIGGKNGVTASELGQIVVGGLVKRLQQTAALAGADRMIKQKLGNLQENVGGKIGTGTEEAGKTLKNILER